VAGSTVVGVAVRLAVGILLGLVTVSACGGSDGGHAGGGDRTVASTLTDPTVDETSTTLSNPYSSTVAEAIGREIAVYLEPAATGVPLHRLANPTEVGGPVVFLVVERDGWPRVLLPVRPNGSEGWIRNTDVSLSVHRYHITVSLSVLHITVFDGDRVILEEPIGVGTQDTPTPGGLYYIKELLRPPDPNGPYGPFAYGLSGFSNQLSAFAGGRGVIGIHGTNDPSSIGRRVSHGCIRMSNQGISRLTGVLPLGVPVQIIE
jgi:L,D-transpeptidase catalytic domain